MLVIDRGMLHNYVYVCKHMFLCDAITVDDTSFISFSPFYKGVVEKGKKQWIKGRPWCSGWTFFGIADL